MQRITSAISTGNEVALREQCRPARTAKSGQTVPRNEILGRPSLRREEANAALPPQQSISAMPPELLRKLHLHIPSPRDKAHFALSSAAVLSATLPALHEMETHLREFAQCANDVESFMLVLGNERQLPDTSRAELLAVLAGKVADIAQWATSSHEHIQAAALHVEQSFRQLMSRIAELPPVLGAAPLFVLGRQIGALPFADRLGGMNAILAATQDASSDPQRFHLLEHLATRLHLFPPRDLQGAAQCLLDEARHLSEAQRRSMCNALRASLECMKVPLDHQARINGAIDQVSPSAPIERPHGRELLRFRRLER